MVKANELRIGNILKDTHTDSLIIVDASDIVALTIIKELVSFEPVPLTPELLEQCGFYWQKEKTITGFTVYRGGGMMLLVDHDEHPFKNIDCYYCLHGKDVWLGKRRGLSLHQLQNLYFALTGEELTVKFAESALS